jgi:predicted dehydrogenase
MRVGVYGLFSAYWPGALAGAAQGQPGVEVVAAAHLGDDPARMKLIMGATPEEFAAGRGLALYEDPRQMIEKEKLEAVVISGPHSRLVDYCEVAAEAGCHFYVAKPMCTNLPDADRIVKAARQNKVIATSGMTERFDAGIREAKRLVEAGEIG